MSRKELLARVRAASGPGAVNAAERILVFGELVDDYARLVRHITDRLVERQRVDLALKQLAWIVDHVKGLAHDENTVALAHMLQEVYVELRAAIDAADPMKDQ